MFKTFFLKEMTSGLKRPMVYIFLFVITLIAFVGVVTDNIAFGGAVGNVFKNAPHIITTYTAYLSIFGLMIATAYFNNAALRDYQDNFDEILFSTPIQKSGYFFGRFLGALVLSTIPLLGIFLGFLIGSVIGPAAGWIDADRMGDFYLSSFLNNYLLFILPNMFFAGAITFAMANRWKSTVISFIATLIIIIGYLVSGTLLSDLDNQTIGALTDVFGIRAYQIDSKYFTSFEKNTQSATFNGLLLINRIIWVAAGSLILIGSYFSFSFVRKNKKVNKETSKVNKAQANQIFSLPEVASNFNFNTETKQFFTFFRTNFYSILRSTTFKALFLFGAIILISKLLNGFEYYGLQSYPVTYKMLFFIRGISMVMGMIIMVFFSGELVWKDRLSNINGVIDATPHNSFVLLLANTASLIAIAVLLDLFLILTSIIYQLSKGYTHLELGVYLQDFIYAGLPLYIAWSCILIFLQVIINSKYIGYFVSVLLIFLFEFIIEAFDIASFMVNLGFSPAYTYSDMNGFGAGLTATLWFNLYWMLFGVLLLAVAGLIWVRGTSYGLKNRLKSAKKHATTRYAFGMSLIAFLFLTTASVVYYNTQVLNAYTAANTLEEIQAKYEKKYKRYQDIAQPKITKAKYEVDIYPDERKVLAKSYVTLENKTNEMIDSLHFTFLKVAWDVNMVKAEWDITLNIPNAKLVLNDKEIGYQIYKLDKPLAPNAKMRIEVAAAYVSKGFENSVSNVRVATNGTFVNHFSIIPAFGYTGLNELSDKNDRKKHGLKPKARMARLQENSIHNLRHYVSGGESDWVNVETVISTSSDQIAIAPGLLIKEWEENGRKYFHYKPDHATLHYFNFMSARYEVARKQWNGVDIEVYYDKAHAYNIEMMLDAVESSLEYYTTNFGPYYHKQARIIEFPRFLKFAEAFPGTMPYSESYGFIINLEDESDNNIIQSVIAHEMAHQWWAHQVIGADMQGAAMLSESFSEYAALMVMKNSLKNDHQMKHFLKYDFDTYLRGRSHETSQELPLYKVEDQGYIHYGKGSVIMYALQDYIGEEKVNTALKNFLDEFKYQAAPYPTTLDFLRNLEPQVPDSLQYLITDWFKEITLYDYRLTKATYKAKDNGKYQISMDVEAYKIKADTMGVETKVKLNDWVDIGVYADNDEENLMYCERVMFNDSIMNFTFEVDDIPAKAAIDPKRILIERVITDNVKDLEELKE